MIAPLAADRLVRRCERSAFPFDTTAELPDLDGMVGQGRAWEAVAFGVAIRQPGYNMYAMGPEGIGKMTLVRGVLAARAAAEPVPSDWCYVHDFGDPRRPRAIRLPAGEGRRFRDRMAQLERELRTAIPAAFESAEYRSRREALEAALKQRRDDAIEAFETQASEAGLAVLRTPVGIGVAPYKDGKVLDRDVVEKLPEAERKRLHEASERLEEHLGELVNRSFPAWERETRAEIRKLAEEVSGRAVGHLLEEIRVDHAGQAELIAHLDALERDVVANAEEFLAAASPRELPPMLAARLEEGALFRRYSVNLLVDNGDSAGAPVVYEDLPTQPNLLGRVEHTTSLGALTTDFTLIRGGALHRANGGYLVLDARRLLTQPFAWEELKRSLRAGELRIESMGDRLGLATVSLAPEPIPLDTKIVLVGDRQIYYLLADQDPDFLELFKVQVDFEEEVDRTADAEQEYARLLGTITRRTGLRPLDSGAVCAVIDRAARLAGDAERLSTHMRRVTDLLREADDHAAKSARDVVTADDIDAAVDARRRRSGRIHERSLADIARGTVLIPTTGQAVGTVNGLTVISLGETWFGRPSRITVSVRLGDGDVVDIEREVSLGGPLHSKGVLILGGFLGARFGRTRPLSLHASLTFEQSYGGIEGDSASLAELCALLSAIGGIPLRQGVALTGSLSQRGDVQPIGGVNEKIEGFFDVCAARGLDGSQGVIVPSLNAPHLMLREDVVAACRDGRFAIWAVRTVDEAMEVLSGLPAGEAAADGTWPDASVNGLVADGLDSLAAQAIAYMAVAAGRIDPEDLEAAQAVAGTVARSQGRARRRRNKAHAT